MSFPQTLPVDQVRRGQDHWRLFTIADSSGDIYESDVSGRAFVIGAESDVDRVAVTFRDPTLSDEVGTQEVSVEKPFIGQLNASLVEQYASGQPARMLISLRNNLIPPGFDLPGAPALTFPIINRPRIDFVQYLQNVPNFLPKRSDLVLKLSSSPTLALGGSFQQFVPFYGRRFFEMTLTNQATVSDVTVTVFGININEVQATIAPVTGPQTQSIVRSGPTAVVPGATVSFGVVEEMFDYIGILFTPTGAGAPPTLGPLPRTIICSDRVSA